MPTTPAASSGNEQPTSAPDASSDETAADSTNTNTTSWTRALQEVTLEKLSPSSRATQILIAEQMTDGYSMTEIANALGRPTSWVSERLSSLRNELLLQTGLFFPLADHEYDSLRASIKEYGVQVPVVIGEHIACVDGRHRLLIGEELGLESVPAVFLEGCTLEQERAIAISLNAARRQLNRQQKRTLVEAELMRDPARSDRLIASICGVTHPTVGLVRSELVAAETQTESTTVTPELTVTKAIVEPLAPDGTPVGPPIEIDLRPPTAGARRVTATGQTRTVPPRPVREEHPTRIAYVTCAHGQVHELHRNHNNVYYLEAHPD